MGSTILRRVSTLLGFVLGAVLVPLLLAACRGKAASTNPNRSEQLGSFRLSAWYCEAHEILTDHCISAVADTARILVWSAEAEQYEVLQLAFDGQSLKLASRFPNSDFGNYAPVLYNATEWIVNDKPNSIAYQYEDTTFRRGRIQSQGSLRYQSAAYDAGRLSKAMLCLTRQDGKLTIFSRDPGEDLVCKLVSTTKVEQEQSFSKVLRLSPCYDASGKLGCRVLFDDASVSSYDEASGELHPDSVFSARGQQISTDAGAQFSSISWQNFARDFTVYFLGDRVVLLSAAGERQELKMIDALGKRIDGRPRSSLSKVFSRYSPGRFRKEWETAPLSLVPERSWLIPVDHQTLAIVEADFQRIVTVQLSAPAAGGAGQP